MSKFEEYLEAVKSGVYNELFNINAQNIKMTKFNKDFDSIEDIMYHFKLLHENTFEELFSLGKKGAIALLKEKEEEMGDKNSSPKSKKAFVDFLFKIKDENVYIEFDGALIFSVGNKLYYLNLINIDNSYYDSIDISFNELKISEVIDGIGSEGTEGNSVMKNSQNSSILFNKIRGIIEKEIPGWKNRIFSFISTQEDSELNQSSNIEIFFENASDIINSFLSTTKADPESVKKFIESYNMLSNKIKIKLKNLLFSGIQNTPLIITDLKSEVLNLFQQIFNGSKNLPVATKKSSKKIDNVSMEYFGRDKMNEISASNVARTRIYKIIINQMFGNKIKEPKQVGSRMLFSLKEIV